MVEQQESRSTWFLGLYQANELNVESFEKQILFLELHTTVIIMFYIFNKFNSIETETYPK